MAFRNQYAALLITIVKLKRWRFLWLLVFALGIASNHIFYNVVGAWITNFGMRSYYSVDGDSFADNSAVMGNMSGHQVKFDVLASLITEQRKTSKEKFDIRDCSKSKSKHDCMLHFLKLMVSQTGSSFIHYVEFSDGHGGMPKLICNMAYGSEAYCPFIASLVSTAGYGVDKANYRFKKVAMFRYVSYLNPLLNVKSGKDTICAKDPEYNTVMPRTVTVQSFLLLSCIFIYMLASTVPCIVDLKRRGFLQLLFRRGMSVSAFWLAMWTVTLLEMLLVSAGLAVSHYYQCTGFYSTGRIIKLLVVCCVQMCSVASLVYLLTVTIGSQMAIGMMTLLLASVSYVVLALSLMLLHGLTGLSVTRWPMLLVPPGLLSEQIQAILVSQLDSSAETLYHTVVLIVSGCLWIISMVITIYLDFVLKTGNGVFVGSANCLCLMLCGKPRPPEGDGSPERPNPVVEPEDNLEPFVKIKRLSKAYTVKGGDDKTLALRKVSVTLYKNQIAAFVGHSGSGKSTLLDILAGKASPSSGDAILEDCSMKDPASRYRLTPQIGNTSEDNALCHGITVVDSVNLIMKACNFHDRPMDNPELKHILNELGLNGRLDQEVGSLSSGQKRKLCTAFALLGNPRLIVLDEPTCNLDPVSRRQLWKLLQQFRNERCIAMSTSIMDEADTLADRKIFLSGGSLISGGSSLFLRRAFDCGFIFKTIVKTERHVGWVLRNVHKKFPSIRARSMYRNEIELEVPVAEDKILPGVAEALEKIPHLVESFGLSQHSLDSIFNRLKAMPPAEVERLFMLGEISYTAENAEAQKQDEPDLSVPVSQTLRRKLARSSPALTQRLMAVMRISGTRVWRQRSRIFSRLVFPAVLLAVLLAVVIVERVMKGSALNLWSHLMNNTVRRFDRGVCIYIDSPTYKVHHHSVDPQKCKQTLSKRDIVSISRSAIRHLPSQIPSDTTPLYGHITKKILKRTDFRRLCTIKRPNFEPCPLMYANSWCEDDLENNKREIALGTYSPYEYFDVEVAASTLLFLYKKAVLSFNVQKAPKVTVNVTVDGVWDFKTTFIRAYSAFFQIVILCILPATYLDDIIEDRVSGIRNKLRSLGMNFVHYWICSFVVHWLQYAVVYLLSVILILAVLSGHYLNVSFIIGIFLPTLILGLTNNLLCAYLVITVFRKNSTVLIVVYSIFSTVLGLSLILAQLDNTVGLIVICVFPQVASVSFTFYGTKLLKYALALMKVSSLSQISGQHRIPFMSLHLVVALIASICHMLLLCLVIVLIELRHEMRCRCCKGNKAGIASIASLSEDQGVMDEAEKLDGNPRDEQHLLEVRHVRVQTSSGVHILRDATFAVKPGEVFGLLGPNGSGKTVVLSAIAGDIRAASGDSDVKTNKSDWLPCHVAVTMGKLGYCQSRDPLLNQLTVEEHLKFYSAVLGISPDCSRSVIQEVLQIFHLENCKDKMASQLSAASKRRLSLAVCLLSNPNVILIDDPSEGVDAKERKLIWASIRSMVGTDRAVVLAVHSMEEAETLCSRVGVMNHGVLAAIGTIDQILNRYGEIYTLSIQLEEAPADTCKTMRNKIEDLLEAVTAKFHSAFVVEQMAASVLICVPVSNIGPLSKALSWLVENKKRLSMNIFSLRRAYLDEIFQLVIKNHDRLLRQRNSMFSMVKDIQVAKLTDTMDSQSVEGV